MYATIESTTVCFQLISNLAFLGWLLPSRFWNARNRVKLKHRSECVAFTRKARNLLSNSQIVNRITSGHSGITFHIVHKYIQRSTTKSGIDFHEGIDFPPVIAQSLAWFPFFNLLLFYLRLFLPSSFHFRDYPVLPRLSLSPSS